MRKLFAAMVMVFGFLSSAFAAVDANTADAKQLESIKGIGPKIAEQIVAERTKNGAFKNADDLKKRVKGIGDKKLAEFTKQGLVIGGAATSTAPAAKPADAKAPTVAPAKPADAKAPTAAPAKPDAKTSSTGKPAATTGDPKKPALK